MFFNKALISNMMYSTIQSLADFPLVSLITIVRYLAVSYTHLDVYKRQRSCTSLIHLQNHERGADRQMSADTRRCIQVYQEWPRKMCIRDSYLPMGKTGRDSMLQNRKKSIISEG